jgi:hypothetical protein
MLGAVIKFFIINPKMMLRNKFPTNEIKTLKNQVSTRRSKRVFANETGAFPGTTGTNSIFRREP